MPITLKNKTSSGEFLEASFLPEKGMNMISYKKGNLEIIDQSTRQEFENRFAGLGPIIGPHFHQQNVLMLPKIPEEHLFPHIARIREQGRHDPFSHGVGRYAPWQYTNDESSIKGTLSGKDLWHNIPLSTLTGQNFSMQFQATLHPHGLEIELSVVSDKDSLVGIHYYYHLPKGKGKIISQIQNSYIDADHKERKSIPQNWSFDNQHLMTFDLDNETDYTFYPFPDPLKGTILLDAIDYQLETSYTCQSQENCWQLYHPKNSSFVCIEPVSSQDPRHPNLTVSSIRIHLEIK